MGCLQTFLLIQEAADEPGSCIRNGSGGHAGSPARDLAMLMMSLIVLYLASRYTLAAGEIIAKLKAVLSQSALQGPSSRFALAADQHPEKAG